MKISQREARALRKRVQFLEDRERTRQSRWTVDYPGGTNFHTFSVDNESAASIRTAAVLGHAIVVRISDSNNLLFYALPHKPI